LAGAVVVALLVAVAALWRVSTTGAVDLLEEIDPPAPEHLVLDEATVNELGARPVIAAGRLVVHGAVALPSDRVIVANELIFEGGARILVPSGHVTMISPRIVGADVDVSGRAGASGAAPGARGANGGTCGTVFVAAESFLDSTFRADGGDGGDGRAGASGAAGRTGYCGPGRFRLAEPGETGGAGGHAGDGGNGGMIKVLHGMTAPRLEARGGVRGQPGRGGPGGQGGAGCRGVRGAQEDQPAGNEGAAGRPGTMGVDGALSPGQADFADVVAAFEAWLEGEDRSPAALRDRLLLVETGTEAP
jgi:hypothetical protein